jgi:Fe-S-cluster containining protein
MAQVRPIQRRCPDCHGNAYDDRKVLPYRDGKCQFLAADDRCTIYEDRPANCRRFECIPGYHHRGSDVAGHSPFLNANQHVLAMLETL